MMDLEMLDHADTPIGTLYLGRRPGPPGVEWVYEIQISGNLLMSSLNNISERALSSVGLELHTGTGPLRVLIGGLGLGYTAEAALESDRVSLVRVIEKMPFVTGWLKDGLLPLSSLFNNDKRVEIVQADAYEILLGPATELYDLILVDVDHSPGDRLAEDDGHFYSETGQRLVAKHLAPGGVLGVWSAWDDEPFTEVLQTVYGKTKREYVDWDDAESEGNAFHNTLFFASAPTDAS